MTRSTVLIHGRMSCSTSQQNEVHVQAGIAARCQESVTLRQNHEQHHKPTLVGIACPCMPALASASWTVAAAAAAAAAGFAGVNSPAFCSSPSPAGAAAPLAASKLPPAAAVLTRSSACSPKLAKPLAPPVRPCCCCCCCCGLSSVLLLELCPGGLRLSGLCWSLLSGLRGSRLWLSGSHV
jgi:hypothetical protein